jgi:competence protein ComFB
MKLDQTYRLEHIRNRTAELVIARVERLLGEDGDLCDCEQCVLDLVAYMLNHVTPQYGTSLLDPLKPVPEQERKVQIEIEVALEEGLRRVHARPGH